MDNGGTDSKSESGTFTGWIRDVAVAGLFLTRLPFRPKGGVGPNDLADAGRAYPFIGLLVGAFAGTALMLASELDLHPLACAFIGLALAALVTGGLHEDGLADVADGFGGGHDRASKMRIMRDSRIGAFGVLALMFSVGIRAAILSGLPGPGMAAAALVGAAVLSRAVLPALMIFVPLARTDGLAATAGRPGSLTLVLALVVGAVLAGPFIGITATLTGAVTALIVAGLLGLLAQRQIGGYTGDVLGSAQQLAEIAVLMIVGAFAL